MKVNSAKNPCVPIFCFPGCGFAKELVVIFFPGCGFANKSVEPETNDLVFSFVSSSVSSIFLPWPHFARCPVPRARLQWPASPPGPEPLWRLRFPCFGPGPGSRNRLPVAAARIRMRTFFYVVEPWCEGSVAGSGSNFVVPEALVLWKTPNTFKNQWFSCIFVTPESRIRF